MGRKAKKAPVKEEAAAVSVRSTDEAEKSRKSGKLRLITFYSDKQGKKYREFSNFYSEVPAFQFVLPAFCRRDGWPESWPCQFSEKAIMLIKAALMCDREAYGEIQHSTTPAACKKLGRGVQNFDQKLWEQHLEETAFEVVRQKFAADEALSAVLLSTGNAVLAEAAPYDCIWGIGLGTSDERSMNPAQWRGRNILGFALMRARAFLRGESLSAAEAQASVAGFGDASMPSGEGAGTSTVATVPEDEEKLLRPVTEPEAAFLPGECCVAVAEGLEPGFQNACDTDQPETYSSADADMNRCLVDGPVEVQRGPPGSFSKYEKMGESSGAVGASGNGTGRYVVTEKVHGANFCVIAAFVGGGAVDVCFAKRTAILGRVEDAEDFYSCRSSGLLGQLRPLAEALLRHLARPGGPAAGTAAVHIYGELFGGRYPHPDVPVVGGLQPVQVGIWYAPDLNFMAFDVAVEPENGQRAYIDYAAARKACESCGFLFASPLFEGTLSECVDFPNQFETTVPSRLGLPHLATSEDGMQNLAEGVVVRPCKEPRSRCSGAGRKESGRGLFKRKIPQFSEKRYQNEDFKKGRAGHCGVAPAISDVESARYEIMACVNEQRLAAVMSKIGRVDPRDQLACRRLLEDFIKDVCDSLEDAEAAVLQGSLELQQELEELCSEVMHNSLQQFSCFAAWNISSDLAAQTADTATASVPPILSRHISEHGGPEVPEGQAHQWTEALLENPDVKHAVCTSTFQKYAKDHGDPLGRDALELCCREICNKLQLPIPSGSNLDKALHKFSSDGRLGTSEFKKFFTLLLKQSVSRQSHAVSEKSRVNHEER